MFICCFGDFVGKITIVYSFVYSALDFVTYHIVQCTHSVLIPSFSVVTDYQDVNLFKSVLLVEF